MRSYMDVRGNNPLPPSASFVNCQGGGLEGITQILGRWDPAADLGGLFRTCVFTDYCVSRPRGPRATDVVFFPWHKGTAGSNSYTEPALSLDIYETLSASSTTWRQRWTDEVRIQGHVLLDNPVGKGSRPGRVGEAETLALHNETLLVASQFRFIGSRFYHSAFVLGPLAHMLYQGELMGPNDTEYQTLLDVGPDPSIARYSFGMVPGAHALGMDARNAYFEASNGASEFGEDDTDKVGRSIHDDSESYTRCARTMVVGSSFFKLSYYNKPFVSRTGDVRMFDGIDPRMKQVVPYLKQRLIRHSFVKGTTCEDMPKVILVVTHEDREGMRGIRNIPDISKAVLHTMGFEYQVHKLEYQSFGLSGQMNHFRCAKVAISMYGGDGLQWAFMMPKGAGIIEIFPRDYRNTAIQQWARELGLKYEAVGARSDPTEVEKLHRPWSHDDGDLEVWYNTPRSMRKGLPVPRRLHDIDWRMSRIWKYSLAPEPGDVVQAVRALSM